MKRASKAATLTSYVALGPFALLVPRTALAGTYYVSASAGSDSNTATQAESKTTPWAHLPGMASCTGACASYSPAAGDRFILKGGDTWTNTDLPLSWGWSGKSSLGIYIGVDATWYAAACGSSWCRPILDANKTVLAPNPTMVLLEGSYVTFDNIELTGFATSAASGGNMVQIVNDNTVVEQCYFHGWSHAPSGDVDNADAIGCGGGGGTEGSVVHDNVIDGSDTTKDMMVGVFLACPEVYDNVIRYVTNGIEGAQDIVHDNWVGPVLLCYSGCHQNLLQNAGPTSQKYVIIYNNVLTRAQTGGMGQLWVEQDSTNSGIPAYVFNNIEFNTAVGNNIDMCQEGPACGPLYFFNNTFECGNDSDIEPQCVGPGQPSGPTVTAYWTNNHCIVSGGDCIAPSSGSFTVISTTNLAQSVSAAKSQGYASTSTEAFAPTRASGATVNAGTNQDTLCATIAKLNAAAGTACQKSTGYACTYDETNHTVSCPAATEVARPAGAHWDIGAYQCDPTADSGCDVGGPGGGGTDGGVDGAALRDGSVQGPDGGSPKDGAASGAEAGQPTGASAEGSSGGCGCRAAGTRTFPIEGCVALGLACLARRRRPPRPGRP
jgi:hypothetical protein